MAAKEYPRDYAKETYRNGFGDDVRLREALAARTRVPGGRVHCNFSWWKLYSLVIFIAMAAPASHAQITEYEDYPKTRGQIERFQSPGVPAWLELNGELRGRLEGQTALGAKSQQGAAYPLTRVRGGARITPIHALQFYLQFQDTHAPGLSPELTASNMVDTFDLHQGYMRLQGGPVTLTAGRQALRFGSERVIGVSDFTNNARSFDGFFLRIGSEKSRLDLFTASVVSVHPTSLDTHGNGLKFHGVYGQFDALIPDTSIQPFLLFSATRSVTDRRGIRGSELRATLGAEVTGTAKAKRIQYDGLLALQRGSYSTQAIHAGAGYLKASYSPAWRWKPRLGAEFDYASGSSAKDLRRQGTYDQLYPSNHDAFGLVDLLGFRNIRQERLNVDLAPAKHLTVLLQAGSLHLASRTDAVYDSAGAILVHPPAGGFANRSLGTEIDASAKYLFGESVVLNVGVGHLFPSGGAAPPTGVAPKTLGYTSLTYRFRFSRR
jgi:hypothetical protein